MSTEQKTKRPKDDPDFTALRACCRALDKCSSPRMVRATLNFLMDRYVTNPPETITP